DGVGGSDGADRSETAEAAEAAETAGFPDIDTPTVRAILRRWPLPEEFAAARFRSVEAVVRKVSRNHVSRSRLLALRGAARTTIGLTTGRAARRAELLRLLERWTLLKRQVAALEGELAALVEQ